MPERGFNPEAEKAKEADREKRLKDAAKNLVEGGLTARALGLAENASDLPGLLEASLPLNKEKRLDLFPKLSEKENEGGVPGGQELASPEAAKNLLNDLEIAGINKDLLENVSKRPLLAIRLSEILNREFVGPEESLERYQEGMRNFWNKFWKELIPNKDIKVPPMPKLTPEQHEAFDRFRMLPIYIPAITETEYPEEFVKPNWATHPVQPELTERHPLVGLWAMVETIPKPNYDKPGGYGWGDGDPLARALGLETRFNQSWDNLNDFNGPLQQVQRELLRPEGRVGLPTVEEWNLIGNLFNVMTNKKGELFPDLGSTTSFEWTATRRTANNYMISGTNFEGRGLAYTAGNLSSDENPSIGFRVLAVLIEPRRGGGHSSDKGPRA